MASEPQALPCEEYEAHVIEFAFRELLMQESRELEYTPLTSEEEELLEHAGHSRQQQLDRIVRSIRRIALIKRIKCSVRATVRYAALFALLVSLTLGTALAVSPEFRVSVIELLTIVTDGYVHVGPEQDMVQAAIPTGWMARYFPGYVPEGYEVVDCYSTPNLSKVVFINTSDDAITYCVSNQQINTHINAENALCQLASICDCTAYLYTMEDLCLITWADGQQFHTLTASTQEIVLDVVESFADISK